MKSIKAGATVVLGCVSTGRSYQSSGQTGEECVLTLHPFTHLFVPFSSIVLVTSKGRFISRGPWTKVLEKLGAGEGFRLKGNQFFKIHF